MKTSPWALLVPNSHQERAACGASRTQKGPGRSILTPQKGPLGQKFCTSEAGEAAMKPSVHLPVHKSLYGSVSYTLTAP